MLQRSNIHAAKFNTLLKHLMKIVNANNAAINIHDST